MLNSKSLYFSRVRFFILLVGVIFLAGCNKSSSNAFYKKIISFFKTTEIVDQYDAIAVWQNNSEGNWDIAYSIYRQKDNNWFHLPDKDMYYKENADLIAKLPGDDNDPDISSTKRLAMAVWSNNGGGDNGAEIFWAVWTPQGWSKPGRLFSLPGDDVDPTVYMQDKDNAMVVWVNRQDKVRSLYYSIYKKGNWSQPEKIDFTGASAIATPELGYMTMPYPRYLLVFTAEVNKEKFAYLGIYSKSKGWQVVKIDNSAGAVVDESIPAKYRTSAAVQVSSRNFIASWSGSDGNIWYVDVSPSSANFTAQSAGGGANGVVLYSGGSQKGSSIIFSQADKLLNVTPVGGSSRQVISSGEQPLVRPDAVYLLEPQTVSAVTVWQTKKESPSEIYFSSLNRNNQQWSQPARIDKQSLPGEDMNPAITPILVKITKEKQVKQEEEIALIEEEPECGDGILDKGEECEIGIACVGQDEICDWDFYAKKYGLRWAVLFSDCECLPLDDPPGTPPRGPDKPKSPKEPDTPWTPGIPGGPQEPSGDKPFDFPVDNFPQDESPLSYGGAACGFNEVLLFSGDQNRIELKLKPETNPANGKMVWAGDFPDYSKNSVALFPLSDPPHNKYFADIKFSNDGKTITMRGIDLETAFQMCIGTFTLGAKPEEGGFVPAPAPAGSTVPVPSLP